MLANSSVTSSAIADLSKFCLLKACIYSILTGTDTIEELGSRRSKSVTLSTCTLRRPSTSAHCHLESYSSHGVFTRNHMTGLAKHHQTLLLFMG